MLPTKHFNLRKNRDVESGGWCFEKSQSRYTGSLNAELYSFIVLQRSESGAVQGCLSSYFSKLITSH